MLVLRCTLGFLTGDAFGGLIRLLLVAAVVVLAFRLLTGRTVA